MNLIQRIKTNIGAYLLHFLFVCILAPITIAIIAVLLEVITGARDIELLITSSFITSFLAVVYGSILSLPMAIISLFIFKWLIDKEKNKKAYFTFVGALFGALISGVYLYLMETEGSEFFLIFIIVGMITGYFLHTIWNDTYTKSIAS